MGKRPLSGIRVIEAGSLIAGAYCAQLLADFGADVIKVELPPGRGRDSLRDWGYRGPHGESLLPLVLNRNKRLITLDAAAPEGGDLFRQLLSTADVFIENFRPGTLDRWGLDQSTLKEINPGLVHVAISGFGQSGPYRDRAAFGAIAEAMGGLRALMGYPDRPPVRAGVSIGDSLAGLFGAMGALIALRARDVDGQGDLVDVALYESVLNVVEDLLPLHDFLDVTRGPVGTGFDRSAPSDVYQTKEGEWILIAAATDATFRRLTDVMGQPGLIEDLRFADHAIRGEHKAEINEIVGAWVSKGSAEDLLAQLHDRGVPATRVATARDIEADPHIAARDMVIELDEPRLGTVRMQGVTPKLSRNAGEVNWPGSPIGGHTDSVLAEILGLSPERIAELRKREIV